MFETARFIKSKTRPRFASVCIDHFVANQKRIINTTEKRHKLFNPKNREPTKCP